MSRRYRLAMRAYPRAFRSRYQQEMLATLADLDAARGVGVADGRSSNREALALVGHGLVERLGPRSAVRIVGFLGLLSVLLTLVPDGWWAHSAVPFVGPYPGVVGPGDPSRTFLAAGGLLAMVVGAPRVGVLVALLYPYGSVITNGVEMGYGIQALSAAPAEPPVMLLVSAMFAAVFWALARAVRPSGHRSSRDVPSRPRVAAAAGLGLLAGTVAALVTTSQLIATSPGSAGPRVFVGPTPIADLGPAYLLCALTAAATATLLAQQVRGALARRGPQLAN